MVNGKPILLEVCRLCGSDMVVLEKPRESDVVKCLDCGQTDMPVSLRWVNSRMNPRWVIEEDGMIGIKCYHCNNKLLVKASKTFTHCNSCSKMINVEKCQILSRTYKPIELLEVV